ncbi:MAG: aminotransferase class IV, partial [Verrucomicrobia bacterium]|nr:aminotransferase class IV [Verrucomicrobiota bacterium]
MASHVFFNGRIVPEAEARVSVLDRGFLYGDGLFETMRVAHGRVFSWPAHVLRFERGLEILRMRCPFSADSLHASALELIRCCDVSRGLARLSVSRGVGIRGYSARGADHPTVVISVFPSEAGPRAEPLRWRVHVSRQRLLSGQDVSRSKTSSKLVQILARMEAEDAGADEALLLNERGELVEAAGANFFWISDGRVHAPPSDAGALPGVAARTLERVCERLTIPFERACLRPEGLGG